MKRKYQKRDQFTDVVTANWLSSNPGEVKSLAIEYGLPFEYLLDENDGADTSASYNFESILADGCFLDKEQLSEMYASLRLKKNLILQIAMAQKKLSKTVVSLRKVKSRTCWMRYEKRRISYFKVLLAPAKRGSQPN